MIKRLLPVILFSHFSMAVDKTSDPEMNAKLKSAATVLDRHQLLNTDEHWIYDFTRAQPLDSFKPGSVKNANAATFPALTGVGMTLAQLNLGPCAMLPPHFHPRADNLVISITGSTTTWMFNENGVRTISTTLTPGKMTIFPRGSLHSMQNNGCDNAYLISALNSEDTGTLNILTGLWSLREDMIQAAFGNPDTNMTEAGQHIPPVGTGSMLGSAACMAKCGISS